MKQTINIKELDKAINFLDSLPVDKNPVDMDEEQVPAETSCGTPACFGGYLTFLYHKENVEEASISEDNSNYKDFTHTYFHKGADSFSQALGFEDYKDLKDFLGKNPKLWGNEHGAKAFSYPVAFNFNRFAYTHIADKGIEKLHNQSDSKAS